MVSSSFHMGRFPKYRNIGYFVSIKNIGWLAVANLICYATFFSRPTPIGGREIHIG